MGERIIHVAFTRTATTISLMPTTHHGTTGSLHPRKKQSPETGKLCCHPPQHCLNSEKERRD